MAHIDLSGASAQERLTYAKQVKPLRHASGMKQETLAEAAGVDRRTISNIERGRFTPQEDVLRKVFVALGVPVDDGYSDETEAWLGMMGALIEKIARPRRQRAVDDALKVLLSAMVEPSPVIQLHPNVGAEGHDDNTDGMNIKEPSTPLERAAASKSKKGSDGDDAGVDGGSDTAGD